MWQSINNVQFESNDKPIYNLSISGDQTDSIWEGMYFKAINDNAVQKGIIHECKYSYSANKTFFKVFGGTNFRFSSGLTDTYVSYDRAPKGFPLNPDLWTMGVLYNYQYYDTDYNYPTQDYWYNPLSLNLKTGLWYLEVEFWGKVYRLGDAGSVWFTLSDSPSVETDKSMTAAITFSVSGHSRICLKMDRTVKIKDNATKYLLIKTNQPSTTTIGFLSSAVPTRVIATSQYVR